MSRKSNTNILLLMSGSIACARATGLISEWVRGGHRVRIACTASAGKFVGRATLEGLGAERVLDDLFEHDAAMEHIHLARWADIIVACPATSNLLNKLAAGIADDLVSSLWQAAHGTGRPMLMVPAMNTQMWNYPATVRSVALLRSWGVRILDPSEGALACGESGAGRLPELGQIMAAASTLQINAGTGLQILITGGGTREPIDSVRFIGNISTGRTAAMLADRLLLAGHRLTWLGAEDAMAPVQDCVRHQFVTFSDLEKKMKLLLEATEYDVVIHAAAVSDFSVASVESANGAPQSNGKIDSAKGLTIHLQPNPKLLNKIREHSANSRVRVIGFKLTHSDDNALRAEAIAKLFDAGVDAVVHNDLGEISKNRHTFSLHTRSAPAKPCEDSIILAVSIDRLLRSAS